MGSKKNDRDNIIINIIFTTKNEIFSKYLINNNGICKDATIPTKVLYLLENNKFKYYNKLLYWFLKHCKYYII